MKIRILIILLAIWLLMLTGTLLAFNCPSMSCPAFSLTVMPTPTPTATPEIEYGIYHISDTDLSTKIQLTYPFDRIIRFRDTEYNYTDFNVTKALTTELHKSIPRSWGQVFDCENKARWYQLQMAVEYHISVGYVEGYVPQGYHAWCMVYVNDSLHYYDPAFNCWDGVEYDGIEVEW